MTPVRRQRRMPRWKRAVHRREALLELKRRMRFRAMLLIVGIVLACIAIMMLVARQSRGAVRVPLDWTTPPRVAWYEARARKPDSSFVPVSLWDDSSSTNMLAIAPEGSTQRAWALVSQDWRSGGWMLRIRSCNAAGCSPWSNVVVVSAGMPDTLWMLSRDGRDGYLPPVDGVSWKRASGRVAWSLRPADTTVAATILHQEVVQRAESARLCALFGFWALRGGVLVCP